MTQRGWRTGPVAITGADGQVGRTLQQYLTHFPNEVRALRRDDDWAAAFNDAEAVVHLAGALLPRRPNTYQAANAETVRRTVAALGGSSVQRVVFLSFITADRNSKNPYLRAKAEGEALLEATGVPVVIFRSDHIYGPPDDPGPTAVSFLASNGRPVNVLGRGAQRLAPSTRTTSSRRSSMPPSTLPRRSAASS